MDRLCTFFKLSIQRQTGQTNIERNAHVTSTYHVVSGSVTVITDGLGHSRFDGDSVKLVGLATNNSNGSSGV